MANKPKTYRSMLQACDWSIEKLPGLSEQDQSQLIACGIHTTQQLLLKAKTQAAKQEFANLLQIHIQHVNKWVALADLARLPSVNYQYCGLLLHAGIASVVQLSQTPLHRLQQQILRLQVATMQRRDLCPSVDEMQQWIQEAEILKATYTH